MTPETHPNQAHADSLAWHEALGLRITLLVGTMACALVFTAIAVISLPGALSTGSPLVIVAWTAQTFIQLVLLPVIIVGQNLQSRHAAIKADVDHQNILAVAESLNELLQRNGDYYTVIRTSGETHDQTQ